jgi:hypothetical protein
MFGALASLPSVPLAPEPSPVEELSRLRRALGRAPRLLVKRDDAIGFAFGGNKVRKMRLVAADALAQKADTLITSGGVQSNHARVTAAAAAKLGLRCILVLNGTPPPKPSANALLDRLLRPKSVMSRPARANARDETAPTTNGARAKALHYSHWRLDTLGAAAFVQAIAELLKRSIPERDRAFHIVWRHSGWPRGWLQARRHPTRVIGIGAPMSRGPPGRISAAFFAESRVAPRRGSQRFDDTPIDIDDGFVGEGYGVLTENRAKR